MTPPLPDLVRRRLAPALALVIAATTIAHADWPIGRHDARRTGAATGTSNLRTPAAYWRQYLGGALGTPLVEPIGGGDVAYVGGGRLHARSAQGTPRWSSDNLELTGVIGQADLDGDGTRELVARSSSRAFVFATDSGALLWGEPIGEMGTLADVRIADVDGRPGAELTVQECYCCQLRTNTPGVVWSFADGWAAPRRVWTLPSSACAGSRQMLFADITGDGAPEFVQTTLPDVRLLDGATGALVAQSPDLGEFVTFSFCEPHDVIAGGGDELVCWLGSAVRAPGTGHRVFVLRYASAPARLELVWSTDVGDLDADLPMGLGRIADLDRDGVLELLATGTLASGEPVTTILDAATGAVLATIPGQQHVMALEPTAGEALLLTQASQQLLGWRFDRAAPARTTLAWRLKDRRVLTTRDAARSGAVPLNTGAVMFDADGDGALDLATVDTKRPNELLVYDVRNPADTPLRSWRAAAGAEVLAAWRDGQRLVVSASDGRLSSLTLPTLVAAGSFRAGQYFDPGSWLNLDRSPVAAQLAGDAAAEIVVPDSRRTLLALDARNATNADPPMRLWELRNAFAATIVGDLGGQPGVMCRRRDNGTVPPTESIARVDGAGSMRWETPIAGEAWNDVVTGNFDGDGVPDVAVQWTRPSDLDVRTTALSGATGAPLWTASINPGNAKYPSGIAVADWNTDGRDDVVYHHFGNRVYDGTTGAVIASGAPAQLTTYHLPTVANLDSDPALEVVLSGGFMPVRAMDHDLSTTLWLGADDRPYPYAALTTCGGQPRVIATSLTAGDVKLIDPATAGAVQHFVLAGGQRFDDAMAATTAGATLGQLASPAVHSNLTGAGRPSVVVGSSDGWLYAFDPCTGTLDFTVAFGAPVGAVAFADTDGDSVDELLASVADGYLYGLKNAPLGGPAAVRDLEPGATSGDDIDEVTTHDALSASWDEVPGATGYEVAIAHADGGYVFYPPWQPVTGTTFTRGGLTLVDGETYVVSVRAISAAGRSPDILSDGVLVHLLPGPSVDAGPDAGGSEVPGGDGCCSTGADPRTGLALAAAVALVLARRRRPR